MRRIKPRKSTRFHLMQFTHLPVLVTLAASLLTSSASARYTPDWSLLREHHTPVSIDGLKFGIYCHWGAQSVLAASDNPDMTYLEAIDAWKGEKFSAREWVDLFQAAGAQFAGPVAWHGSGFLHWDSALTDWNSVKRGPGIDVVGELTAELRRRGMPVLMSFHNNRSIWGRISWSDPTVLDPTGEADCPLYTANDGRPAETLLQGWFDRITEAIDKYRPDIIWMDTSFGGTIVPELRGHALQGRLLPDGDNTLERAIREDYQRKLIAHFFNQGILWGKDVEIVYKSFDIPPGIGMRDIENGSLKGLQYDPWMADIDMTHHYQWPHIWFLDDANPMKDANTLVDMLVDITSKNGRMLLNVPPRPDGTFREDSVRELLAIGDWLRINGEAIYGTIPWVFFGEGPNEVILEGHHAQGKDRGAHIARFDARDIRFTQKGNALYAILLGWPGDGATVAIRALGALGRLHPGDIESVSLLGSSDTLEWTHTADALEVRFPTTRPCDFAYALKIERR
ncbi:MAG: hypothetical protein D6781_05870 [Verrucomicrobia bacterium]|nr:MAG: hypothetical protein D6781_05870 [Verrucomicrobiota bacterium]